jgi:cyclopropane-fatty-acyl-phospholipid synthase
VLETTSNARDADKVLQAYRLYLAGCAMTFERGWISLHQVLATRPDGKLETGNIRGAQSSYPFNREYMYPGNR